MVKARAELTPEQRDYLDTAATEFYKKIAGSSLLGITLEHREQVLHMLNTYVPVNDDEELE